MNAISMRVILKRLKAIKYFLKDKTVPKRKKALIIFGLVYLILPIDVIPPILFPFGFIDDAVLWIYILWTLKDELDKYWNGEKAEDLSKKFETERIVDDVSFEVKDEDKEDNPQDKENNSD